MGRFVTGRIRICRAKLGVAVREIDRVDRVDFVGLAAC